MQWHAISFGAELIKFGYSKDEVAKIICDPSGNLQTAALKEIEGMTSDDV
jgi:hypothetical protein